MVKRSASRICAVFRIRIRSATDHGGLARYNSKTDGFDYVRHQAYNPNSLSSNQVRALYEDMQGNLWVGLFPNGLNYYNRAGEQFVNYRHQPDNPGSISHSAVLSFFEDRRGVLWVGTEEGLNAFDRDSGIFQRYLRDTHNPHALQAIQGNSMNRPGDGGRVCQFARQPA